MKKPERAFIPAFRVYQTATLRDKRSLNNIIDKACSDLKNAALKGYLTEPHIWMQHKAFKCSGEEAGFGKVGPFQRPKEALSEPIFHIHVLAVSYILASHQHHATSDACIVYADFNVHDKRIILLMDFGSSHKGNMPATLVEEYITNFHKLRPGIIEAVKLSLAASEPENY